MSARHRYWLRGFATLLVLVLLATLASGLFIALIDDVLASLRIGPWDRGAVVGVFATLCGVAWTWGLSRVAARWREPLHRDDTDFGEPVGRRGRTER